ncbi:hypothetical protein M3Y94_01050700 [Aphelenchoides besseyi]|nr:hypothetical protein M3Y94_01050700 [Aphelenchoides besseyi]
MLNRLTFLMLMFVLTIFKSTTTDAVERLVAVRPFTAHFFYDKFKNELTEDEKQRYATIFTNPNISKSQAQKKLDSIAKSKGEEFAKRYLEWKSEQDKHNIEWWQVNDCRIRKASETAQKALRDHQGCELQSNTLVSRGLCCLQSVD